MSYQRVREEHGLSHIRLSGCRDSRSTTEGRKNSNAKSEEALSKHGQSDAGGFRTSLGSVTARVQSFEGLRLHGDPES